MNKPKECKDCPFYSKGIGFLPPDGKGLDGIAVVGDFPSYIELEEGEHYPWKDREGIIFRKLISKGGIQPEKLRLLNVYQCHPPNVNTSEARAAAIHCKVHRDKAIRGMRVIVALGDLPFETFCHESGVDKKRGYEYSSLEYGIPVIPSIPPSFIANKKKTELIPATLFDIKIATQRVPKGKPKINCIFDPSPNDFKDFANQSHSYMVVDIETPNSTSSNEEDLDDDPSNQILRLSFASNTTDAITIPYLPLYHDSISQICAAPYDKIFWNANYDVPRLEYNSHEIKGRVVDAMWMWHFLQPDMPRGLNFVAPFYTDLPEWKSESQSSPEWYSCCDAYATANIYEGVMKDLRDRGMDKLADEHVTELLQVLRRMSKHGLLVDVKALDEFREFLKRKLEVLQNQMNESIPPEIRQYSPKNGYVRTPKDLTNKVQVDFNGVVRWANLKNFSPNSSQQVMAYMRKMGHKIPFSKKTNVETTDQKFLRRMATLHPSLLYSVILDYRKTAKLLGTYASWTIGKDGRVRTRFSLAPATGRLSSLNPNVQNIPAEGELADRFRSCLVASPGNVLLRRDYTGAEALLTGYFAKDELFMKLSRIGVYTYVMAKHMKINLDPDDPALAIMLKEIKKLNKDPGKGEYTSPYKKWKTMVLGVLYGLGPDQMFEMNPGVFKSKGETRKLRRFFLDLFPKIEEYQEAAQNEARSSALVKNPFGYIRWLWDVPGLDANKAIAQKPQSSLAAIIKRAMLEMDKSSIGRFMVLQIHDEIVLDCPEESVEETDALFKEIMERPIPELGGLIIRTERKLGRSLKSG